MHESTMLDLPLTSVVEEELHETRCERVKVVCALLAVGELEDEIACMHREMPTAMVEVHEARGAVTETHSALCQLQVLLGRLLVEHVAPHLPYSKVELELELECRVCRAPPAARRRPPSVL